MRDRQSSFVQKRVGEFRASDGFLNNDSIKYLSESGLLSTFCWLSCKFIIKPFLSMFSHGEDKVTTSTLHQRKGLALLPSRHVTTVMLTGGGGFSPVGEEDDTHL